MKVKCDHRSKFSNLSNWKEEAWKKKKKKKKSGLQRDSIQCGGINQFFAATSDAQLRDQKVLYKRCS